jgi:hypothetical protein
MPVLGIAHFSIRTSEISSEASPSSGNAKSLLSCPFHMKNSNTSYIPVGDPSTKTLPSGHHKYASHTCCIQAYSAAALGFRRFFFHVDCMSNWNGWMLVSIMQQNRLQTVSKSP